MNLAHKHEQREQIRCVSCHWIVGEPQQFARCCALALLCWHWEGSAQA